MFLVYLFYSQMKIWTKNTIMFKEDHCIMIKYDLKHL